LHGAKMLIGKFIFVNSPVNSLFKLWNIAVIEAGCCKYLAKHPIIDLQLINYILWN